MSYQDALGVRAGADLSGSQYLAVNIAGTIAGSEIDAFGVLQNKPLSGEDASMTYAGRTKVKAGGALVAGSRLGVNSTGYFVAVTSGPFVGRAINAVASGGVTEAVVGFAGGNIAGG